MVKPKAKVSEEEELFINYFKKNNRPFSPQQIEAAFPQYGKTRTIKILKYLAENEKIVQKESGKAFIYWYNQENDKENQLDEYGQPLVQQISLDDLNKSNATLKSQLDELEQQLKQIQSGIKDSSSQLTNGEITQKLDTLTKENNELEQKLNGYKKKNVVITPADKKKLENNHAKARKEWVTRRRLFKEVLDTVLERSSKKKKDLQEEIGWETDEDLKITVIPDRAKKDNSSSSSEFKRHKKDY